MNSDRVRQAVFRVSTVLIVLVFTLATNWLIRVGDPAYRRPYPATQLCSTVATGTSLDDAKRKIAELGRPESINYSQWQLSVGDTNSACILDVDPSTARIIKATTSGPMVT